MLRSTCELPSLAAKRRLSCHQGENLLQLGRARALLGDWDASLGTLDQVGK